MGGKGVESLPDFSALARLAVKNRNGTSEPVDVAAPDVAHALATMESVRSSLPEPLCSYIQDTLGRYFALLKSGETKALRTSVTGKSAAATLFAKFACARRWADVVNAFEAADGCEDVAPGDLLATADVLEHFRDLVTECVRDVNAEGEIAREIATVDQYYDQALLQRLFTLGLIAAVHFRKCGGSKTLADVAGAIAGGMEWLQNENPGLKRLLDATVA